MIAKNIHRTDMLVDVTQLHEDHLYKLDNQIKNSAQFITNFTQFIPTVAFVLPR